MSTNSLHFVLVYFVCIFWNLVFMFYLNPFHTHLYDLVHGIYARALGYAGRVYSSFEGRHERVA